jgi:hypothetical protein
MRYSEIGIDNVEFLLCSDFAEVMNEMHRL